MKTSFHTPACGSKSRKTVPGILIGAVTCLLVSQAFAASISWNVGGDGNWSDVNNWSGAIPASSDYVTFNTPGVNANETVYLDGDRSITSGTFANTGATTLLGGVNGIANANTLTVAGSLVVAAGAGTVVIGDTSASQSAAVTLQFNPTGGTTITNNGTLIIANSVYLTKTAANSKTLTITGNGYTAILGNIANCATAGSGIGSITNTNTGTTVLAGDNSGIAGPITLTTGSSVTIAKNAAAFGTGVINTGFSVNYATVVLATDDNDTFGNNIFQTGGGTIYLVSDRATAGAGVTHTLGTVAMSNWLVAQSGGNVSSGVGGVSLGTITLGAGTSSKTTEYFDALSANISIASAQAVAPTSSSTAYTMVLGGSTTDNMVGAISDTTFGSYTNSVAVTKMGPGTWTLNGSNAFSGITTLQGGTLKLDYSTNNTSKLSDSAKINLYGGTLELYGGSHSETVASTTVNTGLTFVKRTGGGSSTLQMGLITFTGGAIDFATSNIATTTTPTTSGILSYLATVGGADYATKDGSGNIVAYGDYTSWSDNSAGSSTTVYKLAGSGASNINTSAYALKITTTGDGQSLSLGSGNKLTANSILFAGSNNYSIALNNGSIAAGTILNYAQNNAALSLGALNNSSGTVFFGGTGKTILTANALTNNAVTVAGGALQFSSAFQLGTFTSTIKTVTLNNGTMIADTTNGSFALNNGTYNRNIYIDEGGGTIDVSGGNTFTITGIISSSTNYSPQVTFGSAASSGTIILSGANTYTGGTILAGGVVQVNSTETPGTSGPLGNYLYANGNANAYTPLNFITFTGGTLQYSAANAYDYSGRFSQVANQSFKIDTNGQSVTYASGLRGANSTLTKYGAGTLTLSGTSDYTGATTVNGGALVVASGGILGTPSVNVAAGAAFTVQNGGSISDSTQLTNNGAAAFNSATEKLLSLNGTASAAILTLNSTNLTVTGGGAYAGTIRDGASAGALTVDGGLLRLTGSNSYTGATYVHAGTLQIGDGLTGSIDSASIAVGSGANLSFNEADGAVYAGTIANNGGTVRAIGSNGNTLSGDISGTGGFSQEGSGVTTLSGNNTYSGATSITAGRLNVNGQSSNSIFTVSNQGVLGGTGHINGSTVVNNGTVDGSGLHLNSATFSGGSTLKGNTTAYHIDISSGTTAMSGTTTVTNGIAVSGSAGFRVNGSVVGSVSAAGLVSGEGSISGAAVISGTLAPGDGIGTISMQSLDLTGGTLDIELGSAGNCDLVKVTDGLTLTGATLKLSAGIGYTTPLEGGIYFLIDNESSNSIASRFLALSGTTASMSEGSTFTWNAQEWKITYQADYEHSSAIGGNDLAIVAMSVPEPGTWGMVISGMGVLIGMQRLRRRGSQTGQ